MIVNFGGCRNFFANVNFGSRFFITSGMMVKNVMRTNRTNDRQSNFVDPFTKGDTIGEIIINETISGPTTSLSHDSSSFLTELALFE